MPGGKPTLGISALFSVLLPFDLHHLRTFVNVISVDIGIMSSSSRKSIRLLSLDGGGVKGFSSLLVLERIFRTIQMNANLSELPRPCDYFDLIGGTSTGGLI